MQYIPVCLSYTSETKFVLLPLQIGIRKGDFSAKYYADYINEEENNGKLYLNHNEWFIGVNTKGWKYKGCYVCMTGFETIERATEESRKICDMLTKRKLLK